MQRLPSVKPNPRAAGVGHLPDVRTFARPRNHWRVWRHSSRWDWRRRSASPTACLNDCCSARWTGA